MNEIKIEMIMNGLYHIQLKGEYILRWENKMNIGWVKVGGKHALIQLMENISHMERNISVLLILWPFLPKQRHPGSLTLILNNVKLKNGQV